MTLKYYWTIKFALLTPLLLFIAVLVMGGGHGWFEPAMFLFPFGTINTIWQNHFSIPFTVIAILQYPLYGFVIDKSRQPQKRTRAMILILLLHLLLAAMILFFKHEDWT